MARDKVTIDLDLNAKRAQREVAALQKKIDALGKSMSKGFGGIGGGGSTDKVRALGTGLSKATVRADEFNKSLEASNARVIAFGASAGLIMQVDRALKAMVSSAMKVEKAMADVNVVMNASNKTLEQFGRGMFKVAKDTAQSFDTVAEAATELARQGLGMEKTLSRTKDALILTRLTGMNAADAVKALTAAVNSFNKEGTTSTQVINRMAKVDAAFAVSSEDLAKAISRVGSSAVSAGVSMNQLMAITTSVQQKTARGGAVIGNAFKTIFTRIQRSDVRKTLEGIGVATTDMNGKMLDGVTIIENLSRSFGTLTKSQQASVAENVAGVFQVNILKAAMSDLVNVNSEYARALRVANTATNEAYQRNEELNKTLDALANRTLANLTSAGAALGGGMFEPAIRKVLTTLNASIESFGKGGAMEGVGNTIGKGLMAGIGNFISGPGLVLATVAFGKLALNLGKFATTALKDFMGLNAAVKQRAALEEMVVKKLQSEPALITKIATGERTIASIQTDILATMKLQTLERAQQATIAKQIATGMYSAGARVTPSGYGAFGRGTPGKAGGFIPNFASASGERAAAAAGGYKAGAIRTMNQPGAGTMMYNSAETVKQFPGMTQKAIMPPASSAAGAGYKAAFSAAHGFNPYAGSGFIPNFAATGLRHTGYANTPAMFKKPVKGTRTQTLTEKQEDGVKARGGLLNILNGGIAMLVPRPSDAVPMARPVTGKPPYQNFKASFPILSFKKSLLKRSKAPDDILSSMQDAAAKVTRDFAMTIRPPARRPKDPEIIRALDTTRGSKGALTAAAGSAFEVGMNLALDRKAAEKEAKFGDFDVRPPHSANARKFAFGGRWALGDYKISASSDSKRSMVSKIAKELITNGPGRRFIQHKPLQGKAGGYIPNFSPLSDSVGREMMAGVPASAIRVGSSPALRSAGNPGGIGVYNTIDEPAGLNQGINRSRSMGINPKSHGAASGFIPNYFMTTAASRVGLPGAAVLDKGSVKPIAKAVDDGLSKPAKEMKDASGKMMMAGMMINMALSGGASAMGVGQKTQAGVNAVSNIGGMAMMGAGFGPVGIAAGAALGALTSIGDISTMLGFKDAEIAAEEMKRVSAELKNSFGQLGESFKVLDDFESATIAERIKALKDISDAITEIEETDTTNQTAARLASGARKRLNIDEILKTSGASGLPEGGVEELNKQLETALAEVLSANMRKDLPEMVGRLSNNLFGGLSDLGDDSKGMLKNFKGSYNTPLQEALLGLEGGTGGIRRIKDLVAPLGGNQINKKADFTDTIKAATLFSSLLKRGGFKELGTEMFAAATAAEAEQEAMASGKKPLMKPDNQRGLQRLLFSVFNDPALAGFMNPERVGAEVKKGAAATQDGFTQGQITRSFRQAQTDLTAEGLRKQYTSAGNLSRLGRGAATRNLRRGSAGRMAGITMAGDALIDEKSRLAELGALDKEETARANIRFKQKNKLDQEELKALKSFVDDIENTTMTLGEQNKFIKSYEEDFKNLTDKEIEQRKVALEDKLKVDGILTGKDEAEIKFLKQLSDARQKNAAETKFLNDETKKQRESEVNNIKETNKARKEERQEMLKFQTDRRIGEIKDNAVRTRGEAAGLRDLQRRGFGITEREIADAQTAARRANIRAGGKGNVGQAFRGAFAYGDTDALLEFEDGVVSVANSMKSSFAEAFQSITSGASSLQGALLGMSQSILNSISNVSSQMFTNMLFSGLGPQKAHGGLVRGYSGGGVVTGGSGYKDDVLTKMQGGEYVIKKSAAQKIGYGTLNAINMSSTPGYSNGGPTMGQVGLVAAGASAASGIIGALGQDRPDKPAPMRDYGYGRGQYGFFGGPDPDARGADRIGGGGGRAAVSLNKGYVFYRRDPETGRLISERARPTEGRFEVSDSLSLIGRLGGDDPQTSRMFGKEQAMSKYQQYLISETQSRKDQVAAAKKRKRGALIQGYANAAMLIGGSYFMNRTTDGGDGGGGGGKYGDVSGDPPEGFTPPYDPRLSYGPTPSPYERGFSGGTYTPTAASSGTVKSNYIMQMGPGIGSSPYPKRPFPGPPPNANGGLARVMGGEYVMSPEAVRTYGINFMGELNRGNVPGYANGGPVGGVSLGNQGSSMAPATLAGNTTNNVKISVNIDKAGKAEANYEGGQMNSEAGSERDDAAEIENNKALGELLQAAVLDEIVKQQRPGGLLQNTN